MILKTDITRTRNKFHSDFKIAAASELIKAYELLFLPKSTRYKLTHYSPEEFSDLIGLKYSSKFKLSNPDLPDTINTVKEFAKSKTAIKIFKACIKVKTIINSILHKSGYLNYKSLAVKQKVLNTVNSVKDIIGFDRVLRYFNISRAAS